jgi:Fur family zinc uptake transcriptional regulator
VKEATSAGLARELSALASDSGFRARTRVVEIAGRCARCAGG